MIVPHGNLMVLTGWSYKDALVQVSTLPYVRIIREKLPRPHRIFLVTEEQQHMALTPEETARINAEWKAEGIVLMPLPYKPLGWRKLTAAAGEALRLFRLIRREKIRAIHAFCTPAGSLGYILSKAAGIPLVIDSYEPHADAMVENGTWGPRGLGYTVLSRLERLQSRRATAVLAAASGMKDFAKRHWNAVPPHFFVRPACVDMERFSASAAEANAAAEVSLVGKIVCVYAGKLGGIYLREEIFDFIAACYRHWGDRFRFLMLTASPAEEVAALAAAAGLPPEVVVRRFVPHTEVPRYLALAHFALCPVKPVPTKKLCMPIKDGEYWAMGLPVVIPENISDDSEIIRRHNAGYVLQNFSAEEYQRAIRHIEVLLTEEPAALRARIRGLAAQYRHFSIAEAVYAELYGA